MAVAELVKELRDLKRRVRRLESYGDRVARGRYSTANVANPPTDANLSSAFGSAATLGPGFIGVLDDNGAGTTVYLVTTDGVGWFYELLSIAI